MERKAVSAVMVTLLLTSMLTLAFNIQQVKASLTVHNIDTGEDFLSIQEAIDDPETLDGHTIQVDAGTYYENIVVDKSVSLIGENPDNTIVDGGWSGDVFLVTVNSVTIENFTVTKGHVHGINLNGWGIGGSYCTVKHNNIDSNNWGIVASGHGATYNNISGNRIVNNTYGVAPADWASFNSISGNEVVHNEFGVGLIDLVSNNTVLRNNISNNVYGIWVTDSADNNTIAENSIVSNEYGIGFRPACMHNLFYHNNINNTIQVSLSIPMPTNLWDDGYPSGGNYWSDYTDVDLYCGPNQDMAGSDGIWDHAYVIDANNTDNYPLTKPCVPGTLTVSIYTDKTTYQAGDTMHLGLSITNPDSVKHVCFAMWLELPDNSIYVYTHKHSVLLPIGLNYANPNLDSITLPSIPSGTYTWHAAFLDPVTHAILAEDTAEWQFV